MVRSRGTMKRRRSGLTIIARTGWGRMIRFCVARCRYRQDKNTLPLIVVVADGTAATRRTSLVPAPTMTEVAALGATRRTNNEDPAIATCAAATARLRAVNNSVPDAETTAAALAAIRRVRESVGNKVVCDVPTASTTKLPSLTGKAFTSAPFVVPRLSINPP